MIYFVETNQASCRPKDLAQFGLAHILHAGEQLSTVEAAGAKTPGGVKGLLIANTTRHKGDMSLDYQWSDPLPGLPAVVRVAWGEGDKPTPANLERPGGQLRGVHVKDACDRVWRIPIPRRVMPDGEAIVNTPRYLKFNEEGQLVAGAAKEEFVYLWEVAEAAWAAIHSLFSHQRAVADGDDASEMGPEPVLSDKDVMDWLGTLLAANYVVTARELVAMNAWDDCGGTPLTWLLLATTYDEHLRRVRRAEEQKKREVAAASPSTPSGSSTSPGETVG